MDSRLRGNDAFSYATVETYTKKHQKNKALSFHPEAYKSEQVLRGLSKKPWGVLRKLRKHLLPLCYVINVRYIGRGRLLRRLGRILLLLCLLLLHDVCGSRWRLRNTILPLQNVLLPNVL